MIIKSFIAESAGAALKQVRHAMGGDAVVLKTNQVRDAHGRAQIEVTALLDKVSVGQIDSILSDTSSNQVADSGQAEPITLATPASGSDRLRSLLADVDYSESQVSSMVTAESTQAAELSGTDEGLATLLTEQIESLIAPELKFNAGDRVLIVGSTGSGKSSVMGKLAAKLTFEEQKKVKLVSLDHMKIAAAEELHSYADLLGVEVADSDDKNQADDSIMIIDTPAPTNNKEKQTALIEKAKALNPTHCLLVVSCLTRSSDLSSMLDTLVSFKPDQMVMTMTDLTWRYGSALAALTQTETKLAWVTSSQGGIGSLDRPDSSELVNAMLNGGGEHE